ncbi:MAG: hypothetical protein JWP91_299 [Fibrobacteres bacterium]|nr:hypothetical protein [Fibrobacterota bacterium]
MKKTLFLAVSACISLMACIGDNTSPSENGPSGSARIRFPAVPETTFTMEGKPYSVPYLFSVTIEGPGMNARTQTWNASEVGGKTVVLEDIPSGSARTFTGTMMRSGIKTHQGTYTIDIGGGESVFVPLVLRDVRTGRAEICVEVEGWPGSPDCTPIDTLPIPVDGDELDGCWLIKARIGDTALTGRLSLSARTGGLSGTFRSDAGQSYFVTPAHIAGVKILELVPIAYRGLELVDPTPDLCTEPINDSIRPLIFCPPYHPVLASYHLRIDSVNPQRPGKVAGSFTGMMVDPGYKIELGQLAGYAAACPPDVYPIEDSLVFIAHQGAIK